jgi:DNA-directed RNA polymerase subunit RPC12/RpoP
MFINNPKAFAEWFNKKYPAAYRQITVEDVNTMAVCGLICRERYYSKSKDGKTVKTVLQYEQVILNHDKRIEILNADRAVRCTRCGSLFFSIFDYEKEKTDKFCPDCVLQSERKRIKRLLKISKLVKEVLQIKIDPADLGITDELYDDLFDDVEGTFKEKREK